MPLLTEDEWALTKAREKLAAKLSPSAAFSSIPDVLKLAKDQIDEYAFTSCIWLALDLARKADTTELPEGIKEILKLLKEYATKFGNHYVLEVMKFAEWYRISKDI